MLAMGPLAYYTFDIPPSGTGRCVTQLLYDVSSLPITNNISGTLTWRHFERIKVAGYQPIDHRTSRDRRENLIFVSRLGAAV